MKSYLSALAFIAILCAFSSVAHANRVSTSATTLAIAPGNSVTAGTPLTLTASVTATNFNGTNPDTHGTVIFCDANAARCQDAAIFGSVQLTTPTGTAIAHLTLGAGTYSIKAVFTGTASDGTPVSESAPQTITVTANASYLSFTGIAATGSVGNYTLTGTVSSFGKTPATGSVSFLNTTSSNLLLATAPLDIATLGVNLLSPANSSIAVGTDPESIVFADFNHDGILDMAMGTNNTGSVSILLGNGDGTFQPPVTYTAGLSVTAIVAGDFNRDGNLDLAVANNQENTVGIFLGVGDGTFQTVATMTVGNTPSALAVGDFDGDGNVDLAVLDVGDNDVEILLSEGDGTFFVNAHFAVGVAPVQIATADLNGDGMPDLVVTNSADGTVSVLLGVGNGNFQPQATYATGANDAGVTIADFNGDGFPDLAVTNANNTPDNTVSILLGVGDGTFQPQVAYLAGESPVRIVAADFRGNGIMDLATTNAGSHSVALLVGNGDGTFQAPVFFRTGSFPVAIAAGDMNGDGLPDVVATGSAGPGQWNASILLAVQTETATANGVVAYGVNPQDVLASYPGDTNLLASVSATTPLDGTAQTATTTTLSFSPSTVAAGHVVSLTATIAPVPTGADMGTMSFFRGATLLATALVNSSGIGTLNTSNFPPGASSSITAVYSGNTAFAGSTSAPQTLTVNPRIVPALTLAAAPNPSTVGTLVILTATISPVPGFAPSVARVPTAHTATLSPVPNGAVPSLAFFSGTTRLGFGAMNSSGVATFNTSTLPTGSSNITAVFTGNAAYANSTSAILVVVVNQPVSTTTTLSTVASPGTVGQPLTFTATVSPAPSSTPTGTVSFFNGETLVGTGTVNSSGIATFTTSSLAAGTMGITAVFSGNALSLPSISALQTVVINPDYAVTAPAAPQTLAKGGSVNVAIGVPPVGNSYDSVVTMSASGLPAGATATFNPSTVTPGITGGTTVMTVTLSATAIAKLAPGPMRNHPLAPFAFVVAGMCFCFGKRKQLARSLVTVLAFAVVLGGTLAATGCSGGFGNPSQTVVVTVTGTSGSVQHSTTVTLILK